MKTFRKSLAKGAIATAAAGAMTLGMATPAQAQYRDRDNDGIGVGEIIAGAVVLGGLAAILGSNRDRNRYGGTYGYGYDGDYRQGNYRYGDNNYRQGYGYNNSRAAVEQCVRTAEREAQRYTGARAEVYEIRDIDRERNGYEVKGRIAVQDRNYRGGWGDYRRNTRNSGWDEGNFTCDIRNGRVRDLDFSGIRGL